ncbi:hypothetical protein BJ508DRAFT_378723 [Ascobolus immersus RN42]|uniref:Uncharacterized protein n=1 Tax=Ascobolus immersus RN42 TaxID=1160509 RepID=A0A3N4HUX3_ASCIM|nr:hypothetical protein BJ508DRAFT_378723 [Ascobolus immersus RN42]
MQQPQPQPKASPMPDPRSELVDRLRPYHLDMIVRCSDSQLGEIYDCFGIDFTPIRNDLIGLYQAMGIIRQASSKQNGEARTQNEASPTSKRDTLRKQVLHDMTNKAASPPKKGNGSAIQFNPKAADFSPASGSPAYEQVSAINGGERTCHGEAERLQQGSGGQGRPARANTKINYNRSTPKLVLPPAKGASSAAVKDTKIGANNRQAHAPKTAADSIKENGGRKAVQSLLHKEKIVSAYRMDREKELLAAIAGGNTEAMRALFAVKDTLSKKGVEKPSKGNYRVHGESVLVAREQLKAKQMQAGQSV